ncbi:unnamed protein product [Adineta steineri]|uniref:Uncharacterized protein n=1 Tax=Adineta steineri TaxID=433720 RepID=A0A818RW88_9BILA|nr:unnamed protein product [Adineta steineri]CAF3656738.1 unnamed protein product [Adineta steineri]
MKIIINIFLYNIISINLINSYPSQQCYICEKSGCMHPGKSDIKSCSDSTDNDDNSGKNFVNGAFNGSDSKYIYDTLASELREFGTNDAKIPNTTMPLWDSLTRWVCYVSKDKHRGCLVMGKGLCEEKKSWLGQFPNVGDKINNIIKKAKETIGNMFTDPATSTKLNDTQKMNISNWFAENYMKQLISNENAPKYQLDSCCEGNACNSFDFTANKPTAVLIFLFLLILKSANNYMISIIY